PPPVCRLRADDILGYCWLLRVVHGMFHVAATLQLPPVMTSGALAFGRLKVVKPLALPHQTKPRASPPRPWITSAIMRVLEVPSVIWERVRCGCPARPSWGKSAFLSLSGWAQPYADWMFGSVNHADG